MLEKQHHNYADWTEGRFSEAVTVTGPGKIIFLAGIGAEHEVHGEVQHPGDFRAQCEYAYEKLRAVLAKNGASLGDVVKQTTYVTDVRHQSLAGQCRTQAYTGFKLPAHTFLAVSGFAWPMMLVELDVIAIAPLQTS